MRSILTFAGVAALIAGTVAVTAAPGQLRPGEMTKAEVWVQNREPIPVVISQMGLVSGEPLRVRVVAPVWEYRSLVVRSGEDPARALAAAGSGGWEATGLSWPTADGTLVLLKKAR